MPIDRLNSTAALLAALREDVIARSGTPLRALRADNATAKTAHGSNTPSAAQLRRQLFEIAQGVDLGDAQAVRYARTRFVRAILLWEFGPELRKHPDWNALSQSIDRALDGENGNDDAAFVSVLRSIQSDR